ncbi:MAG TPA: alkaline phosphatase family protein [Streptosporangiaceae bacterium]
MHIRLKLIAAGATALAGAAWLVAAPGISSASDVSAGIPRYQHIVEIMMENTSYSTIIGNPLAPNLNALADQYGLATSYYGVTHPSEPNYVANIGGSYFGIQDDNQFYCTPALAGTDPHCGGTTVDHTVSAPNLASQLTGAGLTWRGYFQSLPPVPSSGVVMTGPNANGPYTFKYPSNSNALYASKHNPFVNFTSTQSDLANMVPDTQLAADLASGNLPNYSLVVPDQCHDMHGTGSCTSTSGLISAGDTYVGSIVNEVMSSPLWDKGNNAIVITWDEDDFSDVGQPGTGCCGFDPGGGHVATIVITNQGPLHVTDATPYNHFSLLRTMEAAFRLPCLQAACDTQDGVTEMKALFNPQDGQ